MSATILALTRYSRLGASSRVRVLQYVPALEKAGFAVRVQPLFHDDDLRRLYKDGRRSPARMLSALVERTAAILQAQTSDIIWLQQEIFPFLPYGIEAAMLAHKKLIIDFDDAHHLYYKTLPAPLRLIYGPKIERMMRRADVVVAGSPFMVDTARAAGAKNVHLVYSAVDSAAFPVTAPLPPRFTVGWIGTPMTARQSLHHLREPLARFLGETRTDAVFIGMDENQFPELPGKRVAWSEASEQEYLPSLSVGLCPLDDTSWTRGKSGYKIIQYMAAGRPALASPVGIAGDIVEDGVTGFHCRTPDDWYRRLHQLHGDTTLLKTLGAMSRTRAETRYDTAIAAAQLAAVFKDCMSG
jgi:glycosyltransferase involved in cell wall biosynthesis